MYGPANKGITILGIILITMNKENKNVELVKSSTIKPTAKPETELPSIDTTVPIVIIVKSRVHSLFFI